MNCYKQTDRLNKTEKNEVKQYNNNLIKHAVKNARAKAPEVFAERNEEGWGVDIVNKKKVEMREVEDRNSVPSTKPVSAEFAKSASTARQARVQYASRQEKILPAGYKHRDEISPILDMLATPNMKAIERLEQYSAKHKCPHGRSWNKYKIEARRWFTPSCDHKYESLADPLPVSCNRCKSKAVLQTKRLCGHEGEFCFRCKFAFYDDDNGNKTPLACMCHQELKKIEIEDELKVSVFSDGQYNHHLRETSIQNFLSKVVKTKPADRGTYSTVTRRRGIKAFLTEELPPPPETVIPLIDFPTLSAIEETPSLPRAKRSFRTAKRALKNKPVEVVQEGGQVSMIASKAKTTVSSIATPILEAIKTTVKKIKDWLLSWTPAMITEFQSVAKFGALILRILTSVLNALTKKNPMELLLWVSCLGGSKPQMCLAISTLLVEALNEFLDDSVWCSGALKILTDSVDESLGAWRVSDDKKTIIEIDAICKEIHAGYLAYNKDQGTVPKRIDTLTGYITWCRTTSQTDNTYYCVARHVEALAKYDLKTVDDRLYLTYVMVEQEGFTDILQSCILLLPTEFHFSGMKTVSMFCKEILPVILVAKNVLEFSTKIYGWITKILGFHLTDTRTWLAMEFNNPDSPVKIGALTAFDYKLMANCDHPMAGQKLVEAKKAREAMAAYIKEEQRFDQYTIKFMGDVDKIISSTSLPPMARKHEPFCVRLFGQPGTGKSTSIPVLFGPILGAKTVEEFYQKSFSRNMSEYWDGVGNRQCILYDDFGQNRTEPVDLMELILLVSAAPFMANFANITGTTPKGMSIDPKLIIASSNVHNDYTAALTDNGAVYRRFHLRIETRKIDGVINMRVDGGSLTPENENVLPYTDWMTVQKMQEYVYFAYEVFTLSREAGDNKLQAELMAAPPGTSLLQYDAAGVATPITTHNKATIEEYFKKYDNVKVRKQPQGLSEREKLNAKRIEEAAKIIAQANQESGLTWAHLFDIWKDNAEAHYLALCYGIVFAGSLTFFMSYKKESHRLLAITSAMIVPAFTSLAVAVYLWANTKQVEPESSTAKGKAAPKVVVAEGGPAVTDIQNVLEKAVCRLRTADGTAVVNALLVGGTSLLTVEHVFIPPVKEKISSDLYFPQGKEFKLYIPNVAEPVTFFFERARMRPITKIIEGKRIEVDAVIYELPRNLIPMRRRIVSRFWQGEILLKNKKACLLDYQSGGRSPIWKESTLNAEEQVFYTQNGKKWLQHLIHGTHESGPGSCGSPVILATGETNAAILGFHVAKHPSGTPMMLVLTRDMIERSMPDARILDPPLIETKHTTEEVDQESTLLSETTLLHLGKTKKKMFLPTSTTLRPSLLAGVIQNPVTEPSVLSNRDPRVPRNVALGVDLYRDGINKMKQPIDLRYEELTSVRNDMIDWYLAKFDSTGHKVGSPLTLKIVFNGDEILNGVDLTTSCGYPYTFDGITKDQVLIREPSQLIVGTSKFYSQLLKDLLDIKCELIPSWFVTGNLKDERRPIEKVRVKPKTRLFTVCPLIMICLEKMYCGHFMRCLLSSKGVPYVGGMDRLGRDWHDMFAELRVVSDRGFGGDYQCYDGSLSEGLISSSLSIMEATLDPKTLEDEFHVKPSETDGELETLRLASDINALKIKHADVWRAVKQSLVNPIYLLKDHVFQAVGTLTSGCWTTQLVGTLSNELMLRAAWNDLVPRHIRGGYFYKKYVENKIMSDDNINAVERSLIPVYNGVTYSEWLSERGMVYTSARKTGAAASVEPLETISFLKNTTGLLKGFYCPLMEQEAAIEISNWIRKSKFTSEHEATEMNANSTLRAMFFHGEPNFTFIRNAFLREVPTLKLVDYNTLYHQYLNYGCFPGAQFEAYNFSEEMNIMPNEPELLPSPIQQEVECSSSADSTIDTSRFESTDNTDEYTNMIEVKQEGKLIYSCEFCDVLLTSQNRLVDHMVANHQQSEVPYTTTLEYFQNSTQAEFKEMYTDLMKPTCSPKTQQFLDMALKEGITKTVIVTTLNNMLSYVAGRLDKRKALNTNAGALDMQNIFVSQGAPKRKINLDSLLASISDVVKTELEEGYTVIEAQQESGVDITGAPGEDVGNFGFADLDGGAMTTGATVEIQEAPLVTVVKEDAQMKDPVDEKRSVDNQEGTILTDKGQIDNVMVKTSSYAAPRAQTTLNDQAWNLEKMLQKWHPVTDVKWSVSNVTGTDLYVGNVLKDLIKSGFAGTAFTVFKDFRCAGVRIKAVMVGSKWHQGRAVLSFSPTMVPNTVTAVSRIWTLSDAISTGAAKFDPSVGGTTEFYIPFRHVKTYLSLEEDDTLGQLYLTVLSPLKVSSSASQEVTIKLFFCIDQPTFKIPRATPITFRMLSELGKRIEQQLPEVKTRAIFRPIEVRQESGQPPINKYPSEGTAIAAQRAKTGDPQTKQFGETDPNLMNHCKRYRKIYEPGRTTMATTVEWETIDLVSILGCFWPLWLFNAYRGAINFKIFTSYTTSAASATPPRGFTEVFFEPRPNAQTVANDNKYKVALGSPGTTVDPLRVVTRANDGCMEFQVPFAHRSGVALNNSFYTDKYQSTGPYIWKGRLYIRHAPNAGIGPNYRSTTIYASLSDEFGAGIFRGVPNCFFNAELPGFAPAPPRVRQEGILDDLASKGLNALKEQVVPEKIISNVLSCLDKPGVSTVPEFVTNKDSGFMNFSSGPEPIDRLSMHPACQQIVDAEHFGTSENEANLVSLFKRPNLLGTFTWKSDNNSQDLLTSFKVHPMVEMDAGVPPGTFRPILLTYLASKFKYWRGGLTYIFEVVGTNFQEGRLDFTFHPNTSVVPSDYETRMSQYCLSCSLKNTENRYAITVPYLAEEPFRRVWNGEEYNEPSAVASPPACTEFHSGVLAVSVGAKLGLPDNVPADVEILVYILPASDFELNTVSVDKRSLVEVAEV